VASFPEGPAPGGPHAAYLETKEAIYHLMACLEGLLPRITTRRERRDTFDLIGRLENMLLEAMIVEELDEEIWGDDGAPPAVDG
jgi:hypothetical protein